MDSSPTTPQLVRFSINTQGSDFAVGDIHGCFTALQQALDHINFNPAKDRLFSVGDLVDRGPESGQVLDWLARPWFHAICGNHDFMIWRSALGDPYPEVNHLEHGGGWLNELDQEAQRRVGKRLAELPLAFEVETPEGLVGLVHADCPYDDWQDMQNRPLSASAADCCLWSRERFQRSYANPVRSVRAVVHGHVTVSSMQKLGNVFFIDTGGWKPSQGHFTFLDLHQLSAIRGPGPATASIRRRYL
ncbi:metallophosphoesterase [Comamonas thiooxydans]|uniref:metallophosphoesterase n=1 Tax=Comamonas thiooxydans TaxID=363952 RepID=UPI0005F7AF82|nr:metallophosphoesterase [Comamonas thiooxydans]CUA99468.1 Calcineurin-like phosphoesterase superfamily domain [Comamonas thiooxydans]